MSPELPSEIYEPRLTDRAYVHFIYASELPEWYGRDWVTSANEGDNDDLLRDVNRVLKMRGDDVQRGDLIYLEPFLYETSSMKHSLVVNSDEGKLIFDGINVMPLDYIEDRYRGEGNPYFIPEQFQVITEFPIRYWEDRIHNYWVPFNVRKHLDTINPDEIRLLSGQSHSPIPYFMFTSGGEEFILSSISPEDPENFRRDLERRTGFVYDFYGVELLTFDIPNPENVLYTTSP